MMENDDHYCPHEEEGGGYGQSGHRPVSVDIDFVTGSAVATLSLVPKTITLGSSAAKGGITLSCTEIKKEGGSCERGVVIYKQAIKTRYCDNLGEICLVLVNIKTEQGGCVPPGDYVLLAPLNARKGYLLPPSFFELEKEWKNEQLKKPELIEEPA